MDKAQAFLHNNCELSIRWKTFKGKVEPTPGLFCKCHDQFLDWLPVDVAYQLIDNHGIIEEIYTPRDKKKKFKK